MSQPAAPSPPAPRRTAALLALLAAAGLGCTLLGRALSSGPSAFAVFWPPSGLLLGALLLAPPRRWPLLLAAAALPVAAFNAWAGQPPEVVAAFAAGNALEALLGAGLALRLCGGRPSLSRLGHLLALLLAGPIVGSGLGSALGAFTLSRWLGAPFTATFLPLWQGGALGAVTVAPLLLAWAAPPRPHRPELREVAEAAALVAAFALASWVIFGPRTGPLRLPASLYLPLLLWAALRFGLRGTTAAGFGVSLLALWCTTRGWGRFAEADTPAGAAASAQLFAAVTVSSLLAMASVIESRRLGSEALRRSERQLRLVGFAVDAAGDPQVCLDRDGTVVYANEAFCAAVQRERARCLGQPIWEVAPDEQGAAAWRRQWARVRREGVMTAEVTRPGPRGEAIPWEVRSSYICHDGQEYCVATARSLQDRHRAETALRLTSMGTLVAGMAHEINNPLAYLLSNLEWLSADVALARARLGQPGARTAEEVLEGLLPVLAETADGAGRIQNLVRDLKLFSRASAGGTEGPASSDVGRAARAAATMARHELRHRAQLVQDLADAPPAAIDEHRLAQVLLNLLLNAAQAIPEGHAGENEVRLSARGERGQVVVEVRDTGCGMSPGVQARIFEPFFTTKPVGYGTGLGLSICHGIVAAAGGRFEVSSRPGEGSVFRLLLPAAPAAPTATPPPPAPAGPMARGRILVVDDDEGIGKVVARGLPEHEVRHCASGAAALARVAAEPFDAILCDLMMPEMSGMEFLQRLALERPALAARAILITGGAFTPGASAFLARSTLPLLEKPFDAGRLRAEIARALDPARG